MNPGPRIARRAEGRRRVSMVTRLVAVGATAVAVAAGVVFAQQPTSTASDSDSGSGTGSDGSATSNDDGTGTGTDDGSQWGGPAVTQPGDGSSSHGSTGGS